MAAEPLPSWDSKNWKDSKNTKPMIERGRKAPLEGHRPKAARKLLCGGGDGMGARTRRGVPEMGFRAGPFVLCKDGCCHQRRRNTNFGPRFFFHSKNFPHICVVKMISATWGSF